MGSSWGACNLCLLNLWPLTILTYNNCSNYNCSCNPSEDHVLKEKKERNQFCYTKFISGTPILCLCFVFVFQVFTSCCIEGITAYCLIVKLCYLRFMGTLISCFFERDLGGCNNDGRYPKKWVIHSHVEKLSLHKPKQSLIEEWSRQVHKGRKDFSMRNSREGRL